MCVFVFLFFLFSGTRTLGYAHDKRHTGFVFREVSPRLFSDSDTPDTILLWQLFAFGRFVLVKQLVKGSTTRFADVGIQMLKCTVKLWTGHGHTS